MASSWLGFKDIALTEAEDDEPLNEIDSFIGGIPMLAPEVNLDAVELKCGNQGCEDQEMSCLVQLYCPLDSHPEMHRSILVLICSNPKCTLTEKSFKVFRIQWSAMKSSASENETVVKVGQISQPMFEECNNWAETENEDHSWGNGPPSKKKSPDPKEDSKEMETPTEKAINTAEKRKVEFKKRFETYFLAFDAEDLSEVTKDDRASEVKGECNSDEDADSLDSNELVNMARNGANEASISSQEDDEVFRKFHHRISSDPSQILRFGGSGEYLPVYNSKMKYPKPCSSCGAPLGCELQILPSFVSCISEIHPKSNPCTEVPLFSLGIFACPNCVKFDQSCLQIKDFVFEIEK